MSDDYECFAGPDACCDRCGDQIGHVRGHFYEDCLSSLRAQRDAATAEAKALKDKVEGYDKLVNDYDDLIDKSRKWYHDSQLWEGDADLGPLWQELWDRRGELSK